MEEREYMPQLKQKTDIFDQWKEAKARFDSACHSLAKAQQERAASEEVLRKATSQVASALETGMYDPTMPSPAPTNGAAIGLGMQRGY